MKIRYVINVGVSFAAFLAASQSLTCFAATINIDFNAGTATYVGTGAAPDLGTVWNGFEGDAQSNSPLVDSFGGATGVTLTKTADNSFSDPGPNDLMLDYLYNFGGTNTMTFAGLTPGAAVDLYLFGRGNNNVAYTTFTLDGANGGATDSTTGAIGLRFLIREAMLSLPATLTVRAS